METTKWYIKNLVNKKDGMLYDLSKEDLINIYSLIWSLTAKDLAYNSAQQQIKQLKEENK